MRQLSVGAAAVRLTARRGALRALRLPALPPALRRAGWAVALPRPPRQRSDAPRTPATLSPALRRAGRAPVRCARAPERCCSSVVLHRYNAFHTQRRAAGHAVAASAALVAAAAARPASQPAERQSCGFVDGWVAAPLGAVTKQSSSDSAIPPHVCTAGRRRRQPTPRCTAVSPRGLMPGAKRSRTGGESRRRLLWRSVSLLALHRSVCEQAHLLRRQSSNALRPASSAP